MSRFCVKMVENRFIEVFYEPFLREKGCETVHRVVL